MLFVIRTLKLIGLFLCASACFSPFSTGAQAALFNFDMTREIPYYKTPSSPFPSGSLSFERLNEKRLITTPTEQTYYLYRNQKISKNLMRPTTAADLATSGISSASSLTDKGQVLILKKTPLRSKASLSSPLIEQITPQTRLKPLRYQNGFIFVEYKNLRGYIDISACITRFDFARAVYGFNHLSGSKQWSFVKAREFDQMMLTDGSSMSLNEVEGLVVDASTAYVTRSDESLPLWTTLKIQKENSNLWIQSRLPGHGLVWWKQNDIETPALTIDEILKRDVSSVSFHPKNSKKAVVSAKGVFITDDGQNWREITQFKNYAGPVLYFDNSLIYVGTYRSLDGGKTFENYIQVDRLSDAISDRLGFQPRRVQVKKIRTVLPARLQMDIDIGPRVIKVQSPIYSQDWKVVKI